tara:strand:+ start:505 stop:1020 length:516 start_codon:yes stop_codon:yes gene_type:complete
LIVPEFENDSWPYSRYFNWGNVINKHKAVKPSLVWGVSLLEKSVDLASKQAGLSCGGFSSSAIPAAVSLCTGTLCLPVASALSAQSRQMRATTCSLIRKGRNPYSLKALALILATVFQTELTVMIGSDDNDPNHRSLRRKKGVIFQGPARLHRAVNFYRCSGIRKRTRRPF